jgi:hypothetical protein
MGTSGKQTLLTKFLSLGFISVAITFGQGGGLVVPADGLDFKFAPDGSLSAVTTVRLMMTSRLASPIIADSWAGVWVAAI